MHPLTHLAVIWAAVFVAVVAAKKTRLTPVLFFLFAGFALVNLGIVPTESDEFIREFAELGIIFIMFALGFEESPDNFLASIKKSWGIALFGALGPFAITYVIADYIWNDVNVSLMCALAMTATAVSLTMVSLRSEGLQNSVVATRVMTSAVIDDIGSLVAVAIVVPLAIGGEPLSVAGIAAAAGKAVLFFVIVTVVGGWVFPHRLRGWISRVPVLGRYGMMHLLSFDEGRHATISILLVALVVGLLASVFGFHPAVGAYMAGLIIKEEYFDIDDSSEMVDEASSAPGAYAETKEIIKGALTPSVYAETKRIVDNAAFSLVGPVFFVDLGAKIVFDMNLFMSVLPYAAVLFTGMFLVQVSTAGLAARFTGAMTWHQSLMIGFGMLGRAELAFVVMDIAYVQNDILPPEAFFTLMITAFFLNIAVPMTIRWWRPHYVAAEAGSR
ncbi:MAG: cation:proton antiporter [Gammaproteobacteria bacterium]|nr:cation:proton antiporter [Gammaproteobacteria bacterium]